MDKDSKKPSPADDDPKKSNNHKASGTTSDTAPTSETTPEDDTAKEADNAEKKALRALRNLTSDDDNPEGEGEHIKITLSSILGGDILGGRWFKRQIWYIVMLVAMTIVYVSNRYSCQQEMIQSKLLTDTLLDCRYKALTRSSELKERTRRSYIEKSLTDTTLQTSNTPSFNLPVDEDE